MHGGLGVGVFGKGDGATSGVSVAASAEGLGDETDVDTALAAQADIDAGVALRDLGPDFDACEGAGVLDELAYVIGGGVCGAEVFVGQGEEGEASV